jgi:hypothetical protein
LLSEGIERKSLEDPNKQKGNNKAKENHRKKDKRALFIDKLSRNLDYSGSSTDSFFKANKKNEDDYPNKQTDSPGSNREYFILFQIVKGLIQFHAFIN